MTGIRTLVPTPRWSPATASAGLRDSLADLASKTDDHRHWLVDQLAEVVRHADTDRPLLAALLYHVALGDGADRLTERMTDLAEIVRDVRMHMATSGHEVCCSVTDPCRCTRYSEQRCETCEQTVLGWVDDAATAVLDLLVAVTRGGETAVSACEVMA